MSQKVHDQSRSSLTVPRKAITVFTKTPAEHVEQLRWTTIYGPKRLFPLLSRWTGVKDILPGWGQPAPSPGHIRVKWYSEFEYLDCTSGDLEADFPLEPNGDLSLTRIQNLWGMDKCVPINPWRMKRFVPNSPEILSSLAIHCLKDNEGAIRFLEEPSEEIKKIRERRWSVIMFYRTSPYIIALQLLFVLFLFLMCWWISRLPTSSFQPFAPAFPV